MYLINKSNLRDKFTIIPNEILRNDKLSWEATGLLCYLLSLPSNFIVRRDSFGRDKGRAAFAELVEHKYIYFNDEEIQLNINRLR